MDNQSSLLSASVSSELASADNVSSDNKFPIVSSSHLSSSKISFIVPNSRGYFRRGLHGICINKFISEKGKGKPALLKTLTLDWKKKDWNFIASSSRYDDNFWLSFLSNPTLAMTNTSQNVVTDSKNDKDKDIKGFLVSHYESLALEVEKPCMVKVDSSLKSIGNYQRIKNGKFVKAFFLGSRKTTKSFRKFISKKESDDQNEDINIEKERNKKKVQCLTCQDVIYEDNLHFIACRSGSGRCRYEICCNSWEENKIKMLTELELNRDDIKKSPVELLSYHQDYVCECEYCNFFSIIGGSGSVEIVKHYKDTHRSIFTRKLTCSKTLILEGAVDSFKREIWAKGENNNDNKNGVSDNRVSSADLLCVSSDPTDELLLPNLKMCSFNICSISLEKFHDLVLQSSSGFSLAGTVLNPPDVIALQEVFPSCLPREINSYGIIYSLAAAEYRCGEGGGVALYA